MMLPPSSRSYFPDIAHPDRKYTLDNSVRATPKHHPRMLDWPVQRKQANQQFGFTPRHLLESEGPRSQRMVVSSRRESGWSSARDSVRGDEPYALDVRLRSLENAYASSGIEARVALLEKMCSRKSSGGVFGELAQLHDKVQDMDRRMKMQERYLANLIKDKESQCHMRHTQQAEKMDFLDRAVRRLEQSITEIDRPLQGARKENGTGSDGNSTSSSPLTDVGPAKDNLRAGANSAGSSSRPLAHVNARFAQLEALVRDEQRFRAKANNELNNIVNGKLNEMYSMLRQEKDFRNNHERSQSSLFNVLQRELREVISMIQEQGLKNHENIEELLQHEIENRLKSEKKIKRAISEQASVQTGSLRTLKGDLRSVSGFLGDRIKILERAESLGNPKELVALQKREEQRSKELHRLRSIVEKIANRLSGGMRKGHTTSSPPQKMVDEEGAPTTKKTRRVRSSRDRSNDRWKHVAAEEKEESSAGEQASVAAEDFCMECGDNIAVLACGTCKANKLCKNCDSLVHDENEEMQNHERSYIKEVSLTPEGDHLDTAGKKVKDKDGESGWTEQSKDGEKPQSGGEGVEQKSSPASPNTSSLRMKLAALKSKKGISPKRRRKKKDRHDSGGFSSDEDKVGETSELVTAENTFLMTAEEGDQFDLDLDALKAMSRSKNLAQLASETIRSEEERLIARRMREHKKKREMEQLQRQAISKQREAEENARRQEETEKREEIEHLKLIRKDQEEERQFQERGKQAPENGSLREAVDNEEVGKPSAVEGNQVTKDADSEDVVDNEEVGKPSAVEGNQVTKDVEKKMLTVVEEEDENDGAVLEIEDGEEANFEGDPGQVEPNAEPDAEYDDAETDYNDDNDYADVQTEQEESAGLEEAGNAGEASDGIGGNAPIASSESATHVGRRGRGRGRGQGRGRGRGRGS